MARLPAGLIRPTPPAPPDALARAEAALGGDVPLADRLRAAVEAKSLRFVEITSGSPHGSELLDESNRLCGDLPIESGRRFREALARVLRRAAQRGEIDLSAVRLSAPEAAELFLQSVAGLKSPGVTVDLYRQRLDALVRVFVAGLGARETGARRQRRAG